MIIHAPGRYRAAEIDASVSLVDLVPTLLDIAELDVDPALPFDGRSLVPHLTGTGGHDEVIGEYMGEGTIAPLVMIRRGPWKFIHSRVDPDMLFNLADDPHEITNRAADPELAEMIADLRAEVAKRWDFEAITKAVIESQRSRRVVGAANAVGKATAWDYQPPRNAGEEYVRAHMDLEELEAMARFPRVRN
jgi:choline-sulfatase